MRFKNSADYEYEMRLDAAGNIKIDARHRTDMTIAEYLEYSGMPRERYYFNEMESEIKQALQENDPNGKIEITALDVEQSNLRRIGRSMKLYERKYTTAEGLSQMRALFDALNAKLTGDLKNFDSGHTFFCRYVKDNGRSVGDLYYAEYVLNQGEVVYRNGMFKVRVCDADNEDLSKLLEPDLFDQFEKMAFCDMMESLADACEVYNKRTAGKDEDIKRFVNIVGAFMRRQE